MFIGVPAQRDVPVNLNTWHERVVSSYAAHEPFRGASIQPGRLWEQLAGDIFLANMDTPLWGWSDKLSVRLLDFWLQFEPGIHFILVCVPPEQFLAEAIQNGQSPTDIPQLLNQWQACHQEMLRFHLRNPQRSVLINALHVAASPEQLVQTCSTRWNLSLDNPASYNALPTRPAGIPLYLARQISRDIAPLASLQHELDSALTLLLPGAEGEGEEKERLDISIEQAIEEFRLLQTGKHLLARHNAELEAQSQQLELANDRCQQLEKEVEAAKLLAVVAAGKVGETEQENELLLLQLHQVQEELETIFLKNTETNQQLNVARETKAKLRKELDAQQQQINSINAERDRFEHDLGATRSQAANAEAKLQETERGSVLLLQQLHQVQEELESSFLKYVETKQHFGATNEAQAKFSEELAALQQAVNNSAAERDQAKHELATAMTQVASIQDRLKETAQENELLLLQLHQVQEELEHYFLQYQDAQKQNVNAESRWQRMLQRQPEYWDYESIEVLPADDATPGQLNWRLKGLQGAGRSFDSLEFGTLQEEGVVGFTFNRTPQGHAPLNRWPSVAESADQIAAIPVGNPTNAVMRATVLQQMATSDWDLLQTLPKVLLQALASPLPLPPQANADPAALQSGLSRFQQIMGRMPALLRFDSVTLKRNQVNPDYEHLWLLLSNLSFAGKRYAEFEFRISCANVRPKHFGAYPKLEFPQEVGQTPFETWFEESYDDFGGKLELRFALPEAMDVAVWEKLSPHDRSFITALVGQLPSLTACLRKQGSQLVRPWEDWDTMLSNIQRILQVRTAALEAPVAPVATPTTTAASEQTTAPKTAKVARRRTTGARNA